MHPRLKTLLDETEALMTRLTPGEWAVDFSYKRPTGEVFACDAPGQPTICQVRYQETLAKYPNRPLKEGDPNPLFADQYSANLDFIVWAHENLPEFIQTIRSQEARIESLFETVANQRKELAHLNTVLNEKNLALDALHYVWCDGGCATGTHQWSPKSITAEVVGVAIRNTDRLVRWFVSSEGRKVPKDWEARMRAWIGAREAIANQILDLKDNGGEGP